ncbi:MAG: CcmD family protein [Gemmatimonadota bacterium]
MSFLVAAYFALWLGVFAYLLRLAARLRELREDVRSLPAAGEAGGLAATTAAGPERGVEPRRGDVPDGA